MINQRDQNLLIRQPLESSVEMYLWLAKYLARNNIVLKSYQCYDCNMSLESLKFAVPVRFVRP